MVCLASVDLGVSVFVVAESEHFLAIYFMGLVKEKGVLCLDGERKSEEKKWVVEARLFVALRGVEADKLDQLKRASIVVVRRSVGQSFD